jgi:hypothetical protein
VTAAIQPDSPTALQNIDYEDLRRRAQAGDESTLPLVRRIFQRPGAVERLGGDLAADIRTNLIGRLAGRDLLVREGLARKLDLMADDLAARTPIERLLVERVVTCWLHLHFLEVSFERRKSTPLDLAEYYQRTIDRAQRRYLAAIKTLATVRKLAVPALQVNIAERQVNVAGV